MFVHFCRQNNHEFHDAILLDKHRELAEKQFTKIDFCRISANVVCEHAWATKMIQVSFYGKCSKIIKIKYNFH